MALPKVGVEAVIEGMASFEADSKKVNKAFSDMDTGADKLGKTSVGITAHLTNLGKTILTLGANAGIAAAVGVAALTASLATFATGGIKQAIDLDQQVANIAATMGATKETAGTLKEELKGLALDLSLDPNLTVDVTQAGQAIEVLAANGALATDSLGQLTQGSKDLAKQTVALANATGSDFATAATIATDSANIFGLEADEMGKSVDGAAGIMNASKFSADDYSMAMANAGPVVAEMGVSLEDFNTVLAGTASNFSSGSDAGTSFKTLFQRLANPTKEVAAEMERYGISLFDADGKMRDMKDIVADLNQVFFGTVTVTEQVGGATKEQAQAAETAAKNMDGLKTKIETNEKQLQLYNDQLALEIGYYGEGSPKVRQRQIQIEKLTNTISGQKQQLGEYEDAIVAVDGAQVQTITSTQQLTEAQRAQLAATLGGADGARILLGLAGMTADEFDTLSESVNRSGQGLEAAALRVDTVKGAMDIFRGVLQAIQIQVGDKFLPLLKQMAVGLTGIATQVGPQIVEFFGQIADSISNTITNISTSIGKITGAFQRFGARGAAVSILGQLGLEPEQIAQVMGVANQVIEVIDKITGAFERFGLKGATVSIMGQLGLDPETIGTIFTSIDSIIQKITTLQAIFAQFGAMGAGISLLSMLGLSSESIALITTSIQAVMNGLSALGDWWITTWPIIQASALTGWEILKGIFAGFQAALGPVLTQLQTQFTQIFAQIGQTLSQFGLDWSDVWNALLTATQIVLAGLGALILGLIGIVAGLATGIASGLSAVIALFQGLADNVSGIWTGMITMFAGWVTIINGIISGDFAMIWEGFKATLQGGFTFWTSMWTGMLEAVVGVVGVIASTIGGFVEGIVGFFQGMYDQLIGNSIIPDLINGIVRWFRELPQKVLSALSNFVSTVTAPFYKVLEAAKEIFGADNWFEIGASIITGILEGIKKNQAEVLEMLKALAADAIQAAKDAIGFGSPAEAFIPLGESISEGIAVGIGAAAPLAQDALNALMTGMTATDPKFIHDFVDDLDIGGALRARNVDRRSALGKGISDALKAGVGGFMSQLQGSVDIGQVTAWVESIGQQWGRSLSTIVQYVDINALYQQIKTKFDEMWSKVRLQNLSAAAGIASQFASIGQGFADTLSNQVSAFQKFREEALKVVGALKEVTLKVQDQELKLQSEQKELDLTRQKLTDQKEAQDSLNGSLTEAIAKYGEDSQEAAALREKISDLQLQIDKTALSVDEKTSAIARLSGELAKNKEAVQETEAALAEYHQELRKKAFAGFNPFATNQEELESDLAMIELLQEFLEGTGQQLRIVGEELGGVFAGTGATSDIVFNNRIEAQTELNRLLAVQAEREQEIARAQEAQQNLSFLQQQISLLNLIKDRGLNPRDIIGGLTLGLNASVSDLLTATNNVVTAMVDQINQDLQIHSPSAVMAKIGSQMIAGLQSGIVSAAPALSAQLSATVAGPISPLMAGAMGAGNSNTTIHNWNVGGNTIATGMNEAEFEAKVIQVIRRNF